MQALKGYRTVLANGLFSLPVAIEIIGQLANMPQLQGIVPPQYLPAYTLGLGILNLFLRKATTTPLGKKF